MSTSTYQKTNSGHNLDQIPGQRVAPTQQEEPKAPGKFQAYDSGVRFGPEANAMTYDEFPADKLRMAAYRKLD